MIQKFKIWWFQNWECQHGHTKSIRHTFYRKSYPHYRYVRECTNCRKVWLF